MRRKIIGVTVGTPISPARLDQEIKPVKSVNGVAPDENGNVEVKASGGDALKGSASGEAVALKDVSPLEHNLGVRVESKNKIPYPYYYFERFGNPYTVNGVTFTDKGDGGIIINGTPTQNTAFFLYSSEVKEPLPLAEGTYYISPENQNGIDIDVPIKNAEGAIILESEWAPNGYSGVVPAGSTLHSVAVVLPSGNTYNNDVVYPMLEKSTTKTAYAPYLANTEAVKVLAQGKNLLPPINATITNEGVTAVFKDGYVTFSGSVPSGGTTTIEYIFAENERKWYSSGKYRAGMIGDASVDIMVTARKMVGIWDEWVCNININSTEAVDRFFVNGVIILVKEELIGKTYPLIFKLETDGERFKATTEYEPYKEPIEYAYGEEIKSIAPCTTIMTDTAGAVLTVEYNKDANEVVKSLENRISALETMIVSQ